MSRTTVDAVNWGKLRPKVVVELKRRVESGSMPASAALRQVFVELFGAERSREDEVRFLMFAAPIARKLTIGLANASDRVGESEVSFSDLREWLGWLDMFDPLCARMIDLHYFAGMSAKETASALDLPLQTVVRELRFAKAWLQTKLQPA
jgi:DNA-directed RNA polymerase specialized sigma24 family protein